MRNNYSLILVALYAVFGTSTASAQDKKPAPCESGRFRHFDFWVGEWEVFTKAGKKAGENSITLEENGCLLVERWTSASGGTGQSYNYVDLSTNKWRQIWVSTGGTIDYSGDLNDKGEMVLVGEIGYPNGTSAPFRGVWTPLENGDVRQHFQQQNIETGEWADWFIGLYKPKNDAQSINNQ